jgi:hypothetical protein
MTIVADQLRASTGHQGSGNQVRPPLRHGTLSRRAQRVIPRLAVPVSTPS